MSVILRIIVWGKCIHDTTNRKWKFGRQNMFLNIYLQLFELDYFWDVQVSLSNRHLEISLWSRHGGPCHTDVAKVMRYGCRILWEQWPRRDQAFARPLGNATFTCRWEEQEYRSKTKKYDPRGRKITGTESNVFEAMGKIASFQKLDRVHTHTHTIK